MALISSGNIGGSSGGGTNYEFYAEQTAGSGNNRTVKLTLKLKLAGNPSYPSWFGYPAQWRGYINGTWQAWTAVKGTESWNTNDSWRSFTYTLNTSVGTTSSKNINVGFGLDSYSGSNLWDYSKSDWTFGVGATNVAPTLSGTITADGSTSSKFIPENQTTIALSSPTANDTNLSGYRFAVSVNGGGYTEIYKGSSRTYTHTITGGQGTTYKYSCYAYDSAGANSSTIYSNTLTKNTMTGDTLASSSSITYSGTPMTFTYSGAKNTNGDTTFTRKLSCDNGIKVYNDTLGASPATVNIDWGQAGGNSGCHIKWNDIVEKFRSNNFKGTLTFTLTTTNKYGTPKTSAKAISVNLQTNPNPATNQAISTDTAKSTMYRTIVGSNKYFMPDGKLVAYVGWTAGSGKLQEPIKYDLYVAYGSGSWQLLASDLTTTSYNHKIPTQSSSQQFKYLIRTKTAYGLYADAQTPGQTLHYWNAPGITVGTITRGATTADVVITVKTNSSVPNIETVGTWKLYTKDTTTQVGSNAGNLAITQNSQTIKTTGLTDAGQYDLSITYKDNTTLSSNKTQSVSIGANSPLFFVNKFGAGVNGYEADATFALATNGNTVANGSVISRNPRSNADVGLSYNSSTEIPRIRYGGTGAGASNGFNIEGPGDNVKLRVDDNGEIYARGTQKVYHTSNQQPTLPLKGTNTINSTANDTTSNWGSHGNSIHWYNTNGLITNQPATYGYIANFGSGSEVHQIWMTQSSGNMAHRGGNSGGWNGTWRTILDSVNYGSYALPVKGPTTFNTNGNTSSSAFNIQGTDVSGKLWTGTGGFVLQSNGSANLHLGLNNSTDMVFRSDRIEVKKKMKVIQHAGAIECEGNLWTTASTSGVWGFEPNRQTYGRLRLAMGSYDGSLRIEGWNQYGTFNQGATFKTGEFYPNGNERLGVSSGTGRWGQIYSTAGSISTSDSSVKEDIKKIAPTEKVALMSREVVDTEATGEDMWNYVKGSSVYSYKYKKQVLAVDDKQKEWLGVLADEIPDNIFNKVGEVSKTQEEYEIELAKQEQYKQVYQEELAKIPATLSEEDKELYDIQGNYGNELVEGTNMTRRELQQESERYIEAPVRLLNSSSQIAMLQEVLGLALNKIESLETEVDYLKSAVEKLNNKINTLTLLRR